MVNLNMTTLNIRLFIGLIFFTLLFTFCFKINDPEWQRIWTSNATDNTLHGLINALNFVNFNRSADQVVEVKDAGVYINKSVCNALVFDEVTDESLLKFYQTCIPGADISLPVGPGLFKALFVGKVFTNKCKEKPRTFISGQELVALASFPGSGNTWTRALLEQLTGERIIEILKYIILHHVFKFIYACIFKNSN